MKVYRLRRCPAHLDRLGATKLLSQALGDIAPADINMQSLVMDLDPWARPPTKVGTLMFHKLPRLIEEGIERDKWEVPVVALEKPLLLDTHFLGMTPLSDVEKGQHEFECIAISGLASHPFGSWAPKGQGSDKSYMWIRDELPNAMPNTRFSIYGYDTTLIKSNSFQSIQDIAASLIDHIKAAGWAMPSARPIVFLAHSLGGIVLKEAFTTLADVHDLGMHMLSCFRGGIFFGVPSQGMATSHLLAMVRNQANEQIIRDLSTNSEYLRSLDDQFSGLAATRDMCIHWAYETKTSPTVIENLDGYFTRDGPEEILVSIDSATRSRYASRSSAVFPINENHTNMVKFREGDHVFPIVIDKLKKACGGDDFEPGHAINTVPETSNSILRSCGTWDEPARVQRIDKSKHTQSQTTGWTLDDLSNSLRVPDGTYRFDTIDENFRRTFEWIFQDEKVPLSMWLKKGHGLFWIHGKPGSGKSTLMKFIFQDQRTWELLHKFGSEAVEIFACFFFHDRGTLLQKSFEGLLRSVLYQIIEKAKASGIDLTELLAPLLQELTKLGQHQPPKLWAIGELERYMRLLFQQTRFNLEIFLLLDALDEYDGQPSFICDTLKNLMDMTASSSTKLKILFSSRPWEAFRKSFERIPSIQLQDYTKDDIGEYCWGTIKSKEEAISTVLGVVAPEIVHRADGVFLWVRLVLRELTSEVVRGMSPNELVKTLDSIPLDLQEYYTRTVQRIPESPVLRWGAYAIFSILSVGWTTDFPDIGAAIECSQRSSYQECQETIAELKRRMWPGRRRLDEPSTKVGKSNLLMNTIRHHAIIKYDDDIDVDADALYMEEWKNRILNWTGGLIEFVSIKRYPYEMDENAVSYLYDVQWAHQTVKEFAQSQNFKRSILGGRDCQTQENGHTFLAKFFLAEQEWEFAARFLNSHERTTGRSMKAFIDSIPEEKFGYVQETPVDGPLALAVLANLQLYIKDTLTSDPYAFRKTKERLLSLIHTEHIASSTYKNTFPASSHMTLQRLIFNNGYTLQKDNQAFELIMRDQIRETHHNKSAVLFRPAGSFADLFRFYTSKFSPRVGFMVSDHDIFDADLVTLYEDKASLLINQGQNPNAWFFIANTGPVNHSSPLLQRIRPHYLTALHIAKTITLARCLLDHGVDVNVLDTARNTPLDHLLRYIYVVGCRGHAYQGWRLPLYQTARFLIEHGGVTRTSIRGIWESCISWYEEGELDVAPLRECFDRVQFNNKGKPKRKQKHLAI